MAEELKDVTDSIELVPVSGLNVNFQLKPAEITVEGKEVLEQALAAYQKKIRRLCCYRKNSERRQRRQE
jgi:hypothetical protein